MNVVVSNRQKDIIDNANIDAIKDLNGLFNVDDLISKFKNYFFSKMILDATSVVNFATKDVLTKLANEIGADKLIVLLPSTPEPPVEFKQLLIDLKIYNFSNKIEDVVKFIDNPNTYDNAMDLLSNSDEKSIYVDNSVKDGSLNDISVVENNTESSHEEVSDKKEEEKKEDHTFVSNTSSLDSMLNSLNVNVSNDVDEKEETKEEVKEENNENDIYNDAKEEKSMLNLSDLVNSSSEKEKDEPKEKTEEEEQPSEEETSHSRFLFTDGYDQTEEKEEKCKKKVIGLIDVTLHAGSTTLVYMLKNAAVNNLNKNVLAIEINKNDFRLFRDKKMISVDESDVENIIKDSNDDLILVDLNDCKNNGFCDDILYLVEPSVIRLNGLMANNKDAFKELSGKKVILNRCLLSEKDIKDLASEAGIEFFYTIAPLNDRNECNAINELLEIMNIK